MSLANIENAQQPQPNSNESATKTDLNIDIENGFELATTLKNLEKQPETNTEETKQELKQETKQETPEKTESPKDTQGETELNEAQINDLLNSDPLLKRVDDLKKLGYSEEDALKAVYETSKTNEEAVKDDYDLPEIKTELLEAGEKIYSKLTKDQIQYFQKCVNNPDDADLLNFIKTFPQIANKLGVDAQKLNELPTYEDSTANAFIRSYIEDKMKAYYGEHLNNISQLNAYYGKVEETKQKFTAEANTILLSEFPAMYNQTQKPEMAVKHEAVYQTWLNLFQTKVSVLTQQNQNNPKVVKKVFDESVKDFKKMYPAVIKRLGMQQEKSSVPDALKQKQLSDMENITSNAGGTQSDGKKSFVIKDIDNSNEIATILNALLPNKEE